jgi:hypothetical protein
MILKDIDPPGMRQGAGSRPAALLLLLEHESKQPHRGLSNTVLRLIDVDHCNECTVDSGYWIAPARKEVASLDDVSFLGKNAPIVNLIPAPVANDSASPSAPFVALAQDFVSADDPMRKRDRLPATTAEKQCKSGCSTDFVMISDCRKSPLHLYAPRPFSFQDLHEHPLGAPQLPFLPVLPRGVDAREASGLPTSEYL